MLQLKEVVFGSQHDNASPGNASHSRFTQSATNLGQPDDGVIR